MSNIAVVVLDTLRKDMFERHFEWLQGRHFENAWSPARWTVPAHASLFTGKYPREVGAFENKQLSDNEVVLPELLSNSGYTTKAFSANPNISWPFGWDRGFDSFKGSWRLDPFRPDRDIFDWQSFIRRNGSRGLTRFPLALYECFKSDTDTLESLKLGFQLKFEDMGYRRQDDDGARDAVKWVEEMSIGENEFLFLNLMEAHEPYLPPKEYRTVDYQSGDFFENTVGEPSFDPDIVIRAYEDSVRYLSDIYKKLFDSLVSNYDLVVTVSDHGEMLGERGVWGHVHGVYPHLTHIPMVLSGNMIEDGTDERLASLLDLHATILNAASVDGYSRGNSLLKDPPSEDARKVFVEDSGASQERFQNLLDAGFDRETLNEYRGSFRGVASLEQFNYETPNGVKSYPRNDVQDSNALEQIERQSSEIPTLEDNETGQELSKSARDQLRDLGYV